MGRWRPAFFRCGEGQRDILPPSHNVDCKNVLHYGTEGVVVYKGVLSFFSVTMSDFSRL